MCTFTVLNELATYEKNRQQKILDYEITNICSLTNITLCTKSLLTIYILGPSLKFLTLFQMNNVRLELDPHPLSSNEQSKSEIKKSILIYYETHNPTYPSIMNILLYNLK